LFISFLSSINDELHGLKSHQERDNSLNKTMQERFTHQWQRNRKGKHESFARLWGKKINSDKKKYPAKKTTDKVKRD